jgi:hypothetical protein
MQRKECSCASESGVKGAHGNPRRSSITHSGHFKELTNVAEKAQLGREIGRRLRWSKNSLIELK